MKTWRSKTPSFHNQVMMALIFLLICRLIAMYFIPLNDTTEARYAEIARKMLETGNWVTPLHDYMTPFWAKPPLSFWLSALSMKLLGVNEFAARLPSFILSLGIIGLLWNVTKKQSGPLVAATTLLVLTSSLAFLLNMGAVMTDPSLLFCTTLTLVSFWKTVVEKASMWRYVFFIGLGLGLLAKGPLVLILTGMPIFLWVLLHQQWRALWTQLPWISGSLLLLLIALPWYLLAESRTPGFLNYFIMGEHFGRFLQGGWQGDKYGGAHIAPLGMIWVYTVIGVIPWTLGVFIWLGYHGKKIPTFLKQDKNGWLSYWFLCFLMPLLFFTVAKNIIWPYVLPSLPAFSVLFAALYHRTAVSSLFKKTYVFAAASSGIILLITTALFVFEPQLLSKSQKEVITVWKNQHPPKDSPLIYWTSNLKAKFSAQFYSAGKLQTTVDPLVLDALLSHEDEHYLVIDANEPALIPENILLNLTEIKTCHFQGSTYTLYRFKKNISGV